MQLHASIRLQHPVFEYKIRETQMILITHTSIEVLRVANDQWPDSEPPKRPCLTITTSCSKWRMNRYSNKEMKSLYSLQRGLYNIRSLEYLGEKNTASSSCNMDQMK
jgi:hypothetical protein